MQDFSKRIQMKGWLLTILAVAAGLVLVFQNCAQPGSWSARVEIPPQPIYVSPFDEQPVHLDQKTLVQTQVDSTSEEVAAAQKVDPSAANDNSTIRASKPQRPTAALVIDNACAQHECSMPGSENSVACPLVNEQLIPSLGSTTQFYRTALPPLESEESALQWIRSTEPDRKCIIGLTEERKYSIGVAADATPLVGSVYTDQSQYLNSIGFSTMIRMLAEKNVDLAPVKVAVIDTGVGDVPDLQNAVFNRVDLRSEPNKTKDDCGPFTDLEPNNPHGTFVAGVIAGRNAENKGVVGIAPNSLISGLAVGDCTGSLSTSEVANAIQHAVMIDQAEVVNLSLGVRGFDDPGVRSAIVQGLNRNVVFIAAAGNDGGSLDEYQFFPASYTLDYQGLLSVGATSANSLLANFSNFGETSVDIAAPGVNIISVGSPLPPAGGLRPIHDTYAQGDGTSFAAPIVSGAAAVAIGYLKGKNLPYNAAFIETLLADSSISPRAHLMGKIRRGAFLDLKKLAEALSQMGATSAPPLPMTLSSVAWSGSGAGQTLTATVNWNLTVLDPGTRLGVFDFGPSCSVSSGCRFQDYPASGAMGSQSLTFTRNELAPVMASQSDPNFSLFIGTALYRRKPNGGLRSIAEARINLRDLDRSTPSSQLLGAIDAVRSDMQHIYFKGWTCLQDSNKTVTVELRTTDGANVPTSFSYQYDLMIPHSSPLDHREWGGEGPTVASGIAVNFKNKATHQAGLEGSPQLVESCRTLTGAHAFELMIPVENVTAGLQNRFVRVHASIRDSSGNSRSLILKDRFNNDRFPIPEVNRTHAATTSIAINRGEGTRHAFQGKLCSNSPSPITMEISFTRINYLRALVEGTSGRIITNEGMYGYPYMLHRPGLESRSVESLLPVWKLAQNPAPGASPFQFDRLNKIDWGNLDEIFLRVDWSEAKQDWVTSEPFGSTVFDKMMPTPPNTLVPKCNRNYDYETAVTAMGELRDPRDGSQLRFLCREQRNAEYGGAMKGLIADIETRAPAALKPDRSWYVKWWDYYDVGSEFSNNTIGYKLDERNAIGKALMDTYKVQTLLREVKKYETPLGHQTIVIDEAHLSSDGSACPGGFVHTLNHSLDVDPALHPQVQQLADGFWKLGEPLPSSFVPDVTGAMKRLPYTLRFFQDGRMILHLQATTGSSTAPVDGYSFVLRDL